MNEQFSLKQSPQSVKWHPVKYKSFILVKSDENFAQNLNSFIQNNTEIWRLGGSTSRGLGKVKIDSDIVRLSDRFDPVKSQINDFNQKLQSQSKKWSVLGEPKEEIVCDRVFFTIDLQSDAILRDNWRRTTVISPEMLCYFAKLEELPRDLILHAAYSSYDYLSGWNSAWGLMKDVELIINKGSVYLFSVSQDNISQWIEALARLRIQGVGERTSEGFGQIEICSEFHLIFRKNAK